MNTNYQLPTGHWIEQVNEYETDFLVHEIFVNQVYLQHGIALRSDSIVFDVGSNIGLFSLYVKEHFPDSQVYSFEPSPEVYPLLQRNLARFGETVRTFACGLSDKKSMATFSYYPGYSVISGFHTDQQRDADIIISGSIASRADPATPEIRAEITSVVKERLAQQILFSCPMTTISEIIQEQAVPHIDLLKMDVEGSELAILQGIKSDDWRKIRQMVMEVHDRDQLKQIESLLKTHHFNYVIEEDKLLKESGIYNLYVRQ